MTTTLVKHLEYICQAHIVVLLHKLLISSRDSDDLSIGFDRDRNRRQRELTNNKNQKGKYHLRNKLTDVFGFKERQKKATYGLGFTVTLTRNKGDTILQKAVALDYARI